MEILTQHQQKLSKCSHCPKMHGPPVFGQATPAKVMLIGQAPGFKEIEVHRPFAWKAGKTLFAWFNRIGLTEDEFRQKIYMAAVCRCYPGKKIRDGKALTGDRVPDKQEISNCSQWLKAESAMLKPELVLPVGKLAINQLHPIKKLDEVVGTPKTVDFYGHQCDMLALPHPSGVSTWTNKEPGKQLLEQALQLIQNHPSWKNLG